MKSLRIIGVGNSAAADDGAGPAVIEELRKHPLPDGVDAVSVGADALAVIEYLEEDADVIIVDAVRMAQRPGKVLTFPAEDAKVKIKADTFSLHGIGLAHAFELAKRLKLPAMVTIVGIEPETVEPGQPMSQAVTDAIPQAAEAVLGLVKSRRDQSATPLETQEKPMAKKVLIVDDDPDIVEAEKMILESEGYEVDSAPDGESGLAKAREIKPDLIILDVMMATMDQGFQVAYKLRQSDELKNIPIMMTTSIGQVTNFKFDPEKDADFLPVDVFIEKPIKPAILIANVEKLLGA